MHLCIYTHTKKNKSKAIIRGQKGKTVLCRVRSENTYLITFIFLL